MADTLTITDNRTGRQYEIPITDGTIRAIDLRQIKVDPDEFGMMSYDPAFQNTASCRSRVTFIDGDKGILRYRGYPIEQLAEHSTFTETAYLLLNGELPTAAELESWEAELGGHAPLPAGIKNLLDGFQPDAHPMGVFLSSVGALSTYYPDAKQIFDDENRRIQVARLIAKAPVIGAYSYRHANGLPYVDPDSSLGFAGRFLGMLFGEPGAPYTPDPVLERALDILFILHADHEQNCSTSAMRGIGSSQADPFASMAGAAAALYGPLHGGANEAVLRMLAAIGSVDNVPDFIKTVKAGEGRLMGFGHRVYKSYDPRATVIKEQAYRVFEVTGRNPLLDVADRARADRPAGRLLRPAPAVPERRLLLGSDLRGDGLQARHVHGAVRHRPRPRLDRAVAGDAARQGPEDRPPAADLPRGRRARLRADGPALGRSPPGPRPTSGGHGTRRAQRGAATVRPASPAAACSRRSYVTKASSPSRDSAVARCTASRLRSDFGASRPAARRTGSSRATRAIRSKICSACSTVASFASVRCSARSTSTRASPLETRSACAARYWRRAPDSGSETASFTMAEESR